MSIQTGAAFEEVGAEVQRFLEYGQKEILIQEDPDESGKWIIIGDRNKFWGWLATPGEIEMLEKQAHHLKRLAKNNPDMAPAIALLIRAAEGDTSGNTDE